MVQVFYNGVALHRLGDVTVSGPARVFEAGEAPQAVQHLLRITVDLFHGDFIEGQRTVTEIVTSLRKQHGVLRWTDDGTEEDFVNRQVTVREADLPEDPNSWGTYHRRITMAFAWVENLTDAQADNVGMGGVATFQKDGGSPVTLTNITRWQESMRTTWMHDRRGVPERTEGRISVAGFVRVDTALALPDRRTALLAAAETLRTAMEAASGTLIRGGSSKQVRIDDFEVEVDQAVSRIPFTFTARYTVFPEESSYATERFTMSEGTRREDGHLNVSFRGSIQAHSLAHAKSRLATLRLAVQGTLAGAPVVRVLTSDLEASYISAAGHQITTASNVPAGFVELQFTETWVVFGAVSRALSMRYSVRRRRDLVASRLSTDVSGQIYGAHAVLAAAANASVGNFLDAFFTAKGWTNRRQDERELGFEAASTWVSGAVNLGAVGNADVAQVLNFSASMESRLTGDAAILECDLTEAMTYSATRWAEHKRPDGPSQFQDCGVEPASRQVTGSVKSASLVTCNTYAAGKRRLLESHHTPPAADAYEDPPSISTRHEWIPRPDSGTANASLEGGTTDVMVYTVEFRYGERMPERLLT